jgi:Flp pilus assembly protein TadD
LHAEDVGLVPGWYWTDYDRGFVDGLRQADDWRGIERRKVRLARNHDEFMQAGLAAFRNGDYERAAWHFSTAADINRGDASSRIFAAQAWLAVGEYTEAAVLIRRAIELQPKLPGLPFDLRDEYGRVEDFDRHVAALASAAESKPASARLWWLLGFEQFFSDQRREARMSFRRAHALNPDDPLVVKFMPRSDRSRRARASR